MIVQALVGVFKRWTYGLIAIIVASLVFVLATWLPNLGLIWQITVSPSVPLLDKAWIFISLAGSITTNFTVFSGLYTTLIALLFGVNAAMVTFCVRQRKQLSAEAGRTGTAAGVGGLVSGAFGVGCAACGSFVLGPLLALAGASGVVALLPFGGQEFGILGVGLLGFSIFLAAKKISEPPVCPVVFEDRLSPGE